MQKNTVHSLIILYGIERWSSPVSYVLNWQSIFSVGQPIYRSWRPKGCPLTLYLAITYNGGSCQRQRQFLLLHIHCNVCTQEQRWKDNRNIIQQHVRVPGTQNTMPSIIYAKKGYLHDVLVETGRRTLFIYLSTSGKDLCNYFKWPLQHSVPTVHWVC